MRIVFAGTPEVALPSLEALAASSHEVCAVVTRPDAPTGRGRKLTASPVAQRAQELGIEVLKPAHPRDADFQNRLRELAPEVCPVVAYGALVPAEVLAIPRLGWINLHFSALPRWRGAAPVQRAIMAGDEVIATSCFQLVPELDAGAIYLSASQPMPEATAGEVLAMLADSGAQQLLATLELLEQGVAPTPQPLEGVTLAPKITVADARIDWQRPNHELKNIILGCSPDPGAWCLLAEERFKIYRATLADVTGLAPGQLQVTKRNVYVGAGEGALELLEVQAAGKRRMAAIDWARSGADGKVLS